MRWPARQRPDRRLRIDRRSAAAGVRPHGQRARQRIQAAQPCRSSRARARPPTACAAISPPRSCRGRTTIAWVWDVYDRDQQRALRLSGEEPAGKAGRDPWAAADDLVLRKIAQAGLSGLSGMINGTPRPDAPPPAPAPGQRGPAVASARTRPGSGSGVQRERARLHRPLTANSPGSDADFAQENRAATGCQPRHLLDITSLVETRRFHGYPDMLNIVSSKARGEASMSAKNGSIKLVAGNSNPALAQAIANWLQPAADQGRGPALRRHGDLRRDPGKRPRLGRLHHPVDVVSGQRPSDGTADHHRRAAPLVGAPHHRGDPLFRLCPAGSQIRLAHADFGQAGGQPDHPCRRRPRHDARPARRADPGLLRHPDRQSLRLAGDGARHQGTLRPRQCHGGVARRRRRGARARACQAHQHAAGDHRQAPRTRRRIRGHERDRRLSPATPAS